MSKKVTVKLKTLSANPFYFKEIVFHISFGFLVHKAKREEDKVKVGQNVFKFFAFFFPRFLLWFVDLLVTPIVLVGKVSTKMSRKVNIFLSVKGTEGDIVSSILQGKLPSYFVCVSVVQFIFSFSHFIS